MGNRLSLDGTSNGFDSSKKYLDLFTYYEIPITEEQALEIARYVSTDNEVDLVLFLKSFLDANQIQIALDFMGLEDVVDEYPEEALRTEAFAGGQNNWIGSSTAENVDAGLLHLSETEIVQELEAMQGLFNMPIEEFNAIRDLCLQGQEYLKTLGGKTIDRYIDVFYKWSGKKNFPISIFRLVVEKVYALDEHFHPREVIEHEPTPRNTHYIPVSAPPALYGGHEIEIIKGVRYVVLQDGTKFPLGMSLTGGTLEQ